MTRTFPSLFSRWAILIASFLLPWSAFAESFVQWTTNYYSVTGATLVEIRQSIRQSRPWKNRVDLDGLTEWRVNWDFTISPTSLGVRCSKFSTRTVITTTMPQWVGTTNARPGVADAWRKYAVALGQHEVGHARHALSAAADLQSRIRSMGERPTYEGLKQVIADLGEKTIAEYRERDRVYDERTRHGVSQGAFLPGRVRRER